MTDVQQRLLLEMAYECVASDPNPNPLGKGKVAVYVGIIAMEYALSLGFARRKLPEVYSVTGAGLSVASGRISFSFGFTGPAITVDTACSASLVGLHLAHNHLRRRDGRSSSHALSCGANALISRKTFEYIHRAGMLAVDGRCKTLDASANGYTRSESVQALLLTKTRAAEQQHKQHKQQATLAVLGGAINQDGRSASLTAPSGPAQQEMLHQALEDSNLDICDISGIQMHGTGTLLGDPIEIGALNTIFENSSQDREGNFVFLSGVKGTIGHAEAAAGLNGVIQAVSVVTQSSSAPFIHLRTLNPYLHTAFENLNETGGVAFVAARQPSPCITAQPGGFGAHGVSAFAFQGTNVHVLLKTLSGTCPSFGSRQAVKTWRHKFFWYSHPNHPLLSSFSTTMNLHNDLVAEACVDLRSPHLSYLRQFKLGNQCILGASVYIDAAGSLVSSMLDTGDGASDRQFSLSSIILGFPRTIKVEGAGASEERPSMSQFVCQIDLKSGWLVFGDRNSLLEEDALRVSREFSCFVTPVPSARSAPGSKGCPGAVRAERGSVLDAVSGTQTQSITAYPRPGARESNRNHDVIASIRALGSYHIPDDDVSLDLLRVECGMCSIYAQLASGMSSMLPWEQTSIISNSLSYPSSIECFQTGSKVKRSGGETRIGCKAMEHQSLEAPLICDYDWSSMTNPNQCSIKAHNVKWAPMIFRSKLIEGVDLKVSNQAGQALASSQGENAGKSKEDYELVIQGIIEELVGEPVGIEDSLHAHAVDSFTAEEVATLISRSVSYKVSATFIFDYPNIKLMAEFLHDKLGGKGKKSLGAVPRREKRLLHRAGRLGRSASHCIVSVQNVSAILPSNTFVDENARAQQDAIGTIPLARWDLDFDSLGAATLPRFGGFIELHKWFDNSFFGVSIAESEHIDCRQCFLLTCAYEALQRDSSLTSNGSSTSTSNVATGVYVGIQSMPADTPFKCNLGLTGYHGTGSSMSVASGRISYVFGFRGPSLCIDTACSSSLLALYFGKDRLQSDPCLDQALSCGAHCYQSDKGFQVMMHAGMLAVDGRCKTLDASANGYTRSESVQALLLTKTRAAEQQHKQHKQQATLAVLGGAINQDGRSASLTAPSGPAQQEMLHQALEDSNLDICDISGIQMHGTGTLLGDPIEIGALNTIFENSSQDREGNFVFLSGVKGTIGHAEAAAGLNGVIQAVSVVTQSSSAPFIHLRTLNPYLHTAFENLNETGGVAFVAARQPSPCITAQPGGFGAHGVSAFAFQGTNVHVLLKTLSGTCPSFGSRQAVKTWRHKFFWYSHPNHPLLSSFSTTMNLHNDLVAEACVDLRSPHLSYLRQFKLGNQCILGASVYIDAAGSLVSSMLDTGDGASDRQFSLSSIIFGEPKCVADPRVNSTSATTNLRPLHLRCEIHLSLGLVNAGFVEKSSSRTSFAGHVRTSAWDTKDTSIGGAPTSHQKCCLKESFAKDRGCCNASVYLPAIENVSEYVLHPLLFESCLIASAAMEECSMIFPRQVSNCALSAPSKRIKCPNAEIQNYLDETHLHVGSRPKTSICGILYAGKKRAPILSEVNESSALVKARLSPASDEDYESENTYSLADFESCEKSFSEACQFVSSSTIDIGDNPLNAMRLGSGSELDMVKKIVCEITGSSVDEIEDEEPLIGAGLDSIAALELRTKLQDMLGVQLPVTLLQDHPSIASLRSLVETTSQSLSVHDGDMASSISIQSEHFQPAIYVPFLFKSAFMSSFIRKKDDSFFPVWYPLLVYYITIFIPIFWVFEKLQHLIVLWRGNVREYQVKLQSIAGMESTEPMKEKIVPMTHDDASYSHIYVSACLEFDGIISELNLCNSLKIALSHFPSLAGNLIRRGRNMYLKYGGESDFVRVLALEYNRKEDIQFKSGMIQEPNPKPKPGWLQTLESIGLRLLYAYKCAKARGHPCMKIYIHQNFQTDNPQTLITVRWNHAVADGSTIYKFLGAWGMADKGGRILSTHPGPLESLTNRQHALLASILMSESKSSLYFPSRSFWSPPFNSVLIKFTEEEIRGYQNRQVNGHANRVDVVSSLLWLAMAKACYPSRQQLEDDSYCDYASWHPRVSFLTDLRNHMSELQCFTGNLVRCTEPFCPMRDPVADLQTILGRDIEETMHHIGQQRKHVRWSMDYVEEYLQLPGVPLCMQAMQDALMSGKNGPCLLVNDLTSFRGPFNFADGVAQVSHASTSSDWSPGDASLMQALDDTDLSNFSENTFWFAHLKNQGNDIVCALVTFS